jgi:hypothetical protein
VLHGRQESYPNSSKEGAMKKEGKLCGSTQKRFDLSSSLHAKNRLQGGFSYECGLVEDVRTAVQENSDFLVPVQQLLERIHQDNGRDQVLQHAV